MCHFDFRKKLKTENDRKAQIGKEKWSKNSVQLLLDNVS